MWMRCLGILVVAHLLARPLAAADPLPVGSQPAPLEFPHFPDRLHAVVWRNWQLVESGRLAETLGTSAEQVERLAASMGLPPAGAVSPAWRRRGYITLVRRNWHLLPYDQLLTLIDMQADEFAEALREDDFLYIKLGSLKPRCDPVRYVEPDAAARQRAAQIHRIVADRFGDALTSSREAPFQFIEALSRPPQSAGSARTANRASDGPRYIYSYFGSYGDPLADPELDPYPDGLLARLADNGVNGVWLHVLLRQLAPGGEHFPEFGQGRQQRLDNLRRLVAKARQHGISVYLYMNEPRALPASFFKSRPELAGVAEGEWNAVCTSDPRVRDWLRDALRYLFAEVPGLGGVFTITASENLTHCASHGKHRDCPRCRQRTDEEIIAEVNRVIAEGVHASAPQARVIAWDWGWKGHGDAPGIISRLPKDVWLMSVSEWQTPIARGGVPTTVGEYSLSVVGPGPRAQRHWQLAREAQLKTVAKVQLGTTWELSAVPYLPVMDLVAEHCARLARSQIDGMMLSWSLGCYPSPNLRIAHWFAENPQASVESVLQRLAVERYGSEGAGAARQAWSAFSRSFAEYPYHGVVVYNGPQQMGPANLLFERPTGYRSTMVGFPYDDLNGWRGPYPAGIYIQQMQKVADGWRTGLTALQQAVAAAPPDLRPEAEAELRVARAAWLHLASVANQARFVQRRTESLASPPPTGDPAGTRQQMVQILEDEARLARELFDVARSDSRIGFEASNHYYYVPLDLVEKVVSCEMLRDRLMQQIAGGAAK